MQLLRRSLCSRRFLLCSNTPRDVLQESTPCCFYLQVLSDRRAYVQVLEVDQVEFSSYLPDDKPTTLSEAVAFVDIQQARLQDNRVRLHSDTYQVCTHATAGHGQTAFKFHLPASWSGSSNLILLHASHALPCHGQWQMHAYDLCVESSQPPQHKPEVVFRAYHADMPPPLLCLLPMPLLSLAGPAGAAGCAGASS